jgi:aspartyl-tRNA(Asn)/glutamyl-tRNA(Gln) amidotransferase subunit C
VGYFTLKSRFFFLARMGQLGRYTPPIESFSKPKVSMSEITPELVRHLAGLARIEVSDAEVAQFASQLALIVDSVATVKAAVSDDIAATSHPIPMANVFREDAVRPSLTQAQALSGAAESESGRFKVSAILDED